MASTFHGLETAKRGMYTQQSALYTTGHNIANANTPGFSRQRVNFVQTEPYPAAAMNRPQIPGQMGTGVEAGSVQRVRESFLDVQYQGENNKMGYWQSRAEALNKMEDIMNEPSDSGLAKVMGQFWQSLQDLSVNPENEGARTVVLQRGQAVADTFHYMHDSISAIRDDIGNEISVTVKEVNSLLEQISKLNKQIGEIEPHGYLPNDLYDERDRLVDQLSQHINIKVDKVPSGGNALKIAEGQYVISMFHADGITPTEIVNSANFNKVGLQSDPVAADSEGDGVVDKPNDPITHFTVNGEEITVNNFSQGRLRGLAESYGYKDNANNTKGIYPQMLDDLDKMAYSFGSIFNEVHSLGYGMEQDQPQSKPFFDGIADSKANYKDAAKTIQLGSLTSEEVAASVIGMNDGNGTNAINLANIQGFILTNSTQKLEGIAGSIDLTQLSAINNGTIKSFYEGIIGRLGVDAQQATRLGKNSEVLRQSVETNRQSISSVSLDEEMTNMIKFQHAYNAAARNITVVDEMLDKIINGMGTGGR
ncbi:flagellar hook-associated protein 1 FlgK [Bacillus ectoiniformans]|uniref:flagellar hook-associated protein FlgK n=1 Tax=Bacillus ectoiniformans TaxID=1494429 RepID=UPI00195637AB|nr:flagellar hook-associated protein FlgK [Bacillus ectoiniformans]MBM7649359.1 flagellar hook-associated protein 1 FlgK [Bacillus ectoiniformans]